MEEVPSCTPCYPAGQQEAQGRTRPQRKVIIAIKGLETKPHEEWAGETGYIQPGQEKTEGKYYQHPEISMMPMMEQACFLGPQRVEPKLMDSN